MSRIVLGEIDALTARLEAAAARLDAVESSRRPVTPAEVSADLAQAKEKWVVVGAIASRAASEAAVAALRTVLDEQPKRPPISSWATRSILALLSANLLATFGGIAYLVATR